MKRLHLPVTVLLIVVLLGVGCDREPPPLAVSDLTPDEAYCLEHLVLLERARAVALADPELGAVVLDSLAVAWGDSFARDLERRLPVEPRRASRFHDLLLRVLEAENDSLTFAPRRGRLTAPFWPEDPDDAITNQ